MNFSSLNDYLNNIIKVINQHAKLLNTLNQEIQVRTTEKAVGEMFTLISSGLPYDTLQRKIGGLPSRRTSAMAKQLGDSHHHTNTNSNATSKMMTQDEILN